MNNPKRANKYMGKDEPRCSVCYQKILHRQHVRSNDDGTLRHVHCYAKAHHSARRNTREKELVRETRGFRRKSKCA